MAKRIPTKASAVPRSGWRRTSPRGTPTSAEGARMSRREARGSSRWARSRASTRMVAILPISAGWKRMKPRLMKLFTPAAVPAPVPMTRVAARRTTLRT